GFDSLPRSLLAGAAGMGATGARRAKRGRGPATAAPHLETLLWRVGIRHVAGVDEVGMGPLAGPVVAAAVVFPPGTPPDRVAASTGATRATASRATWATRRARTSPPSARSGRRPSIAAPSPRCGPPRAARPIRSSRWVRCWLRTDARGAFPGAENAYNRPHPMDATLLLDLYRQMCLSRRFEEAAAKAYSQGKVSGFLHLYIGQEAVAVGAISAAQPTDYIVATYREHAHYLARTGDARGAMAELYGRATGCSGGRGGSMHLFDARKRFFGGWAIVGGHVPIAAGVAFGSKYRGEPDVTLCFFGDGTANM